MHKIFSSLLLGFFVMITAEARRAPQRIMDRLEENSRINLTDPPKDNEVCFSPDESCAGKIIKFIESSKDSLDIAIFEMTDRKIGQAIATAAEKIKVRVIVDKKLMKDNGPAFDFVKSSKAQIRVGKQKGLMHNKFTIVDGKRLETGSFNYTYGAEHSNHENQIYLSTPAIISRFQEQFEKLWKEAN